MNAQEEVPKVLNTGIKASFLLTGGFNHASGKEISQVYGPGYILGMGVGIRLASDHLWIIPSVGGTYFGNQPNEALRDDLLLWNGGVSASWLFPLGKNQALRLAPELGGYYVIGGNKFRPRKDYTGRTIQVYSFKDFSLKPGLSLVLKRVKITAAYNILHVKGKLDEALKDEFTQTAWGELNPPVYKMYLFPDYEFDMSHFQLSLTGIF